jgi:type VII secretion effector (TIGR04197 family)
MTTLLIDPEVGTSTGNSISNSVSGFNAEALATPDTRTTLTANQNAHNAFANSQDMVTSFSAAIGTAGNVLVSISVALREADESAIQNDETNLPILSPEAGSRH